MPGRTNPPIATLALHVNIDLLCEGTMADVLPCAIHRASDSLYGQNSNQCVETFKLSHTYAILLQVMR